MPLEDYMHDINTRSLDSMHKFVYAMISHTGDLFNFRYFFIKWSFIFTLSRPLIMIFFKCTRRGNHLLGSSQRARLDIRDITEELH